MSKRITGVIKITVEIEVDDGTDEAIEDKLNSIGREMFHTFDQIATDYAIHDYSDGWAEDD